MKPFTSSTAQITVNKPKIQKALDFMKISQTLVYRGRLDTLCPRTGDMAMIKVTP